MPLARYTAIANSGVYHVFGRGVEKRQIYFSHCEYERFWLRLFRYAAEEGVTIYCACLKRNHFHIMVYCDSINQLSRMLHRLLTSYAMYFNKKLDRVGHLFQSRYNSKPVETEPYFNQLVKYIKANADQPNYPWLFVSKDCPRLQPV